MATIGKSFSDPDKWEDPFFLALSPGKKLLYQYLWDRCDHAGVIHITITVWAAHTGLEINDTMLDSFISEINEDQERIVRINRKLWFTEYIRFNQQSDPELPLSDTYSFHKHVWKLVQKHKLIEEIQKRDPILLLKFLENNNGVNATETDTPKANISLNQDLPKPTGKGAGKGVGYGEGLGKEREPDTIDLSDDEQLFGTPSLDGTDSEESAADFERSNWKQKAEGTPFDY